jgi:hypothetical protein
LQPPWQPELQPPQVSSQPQLKRRERSRDRKLGFLQGSQQALPQLLLLQALPQLLLQAFSQGTYRGLRTQTSTSLQTGTFLQTVTGTHSVTQ